MSGAQLYSANIAVPASQYGNNVVLGLPSGASTAVGETGSYAPSAIGIPQGCTATAMHVSAFGFIGSDGNNVNAKVSLLAGSETDVSNGTMAATALACTINDPTSQSTSVNGDCTSKGSVTLNATQFITIQIDFGENSYYFNNTNFLVRFVCR